ncbi:hypothetical protein AAC387_Pa05g2656 [Persea americana]
MRHSTSAEGEEPYLNRDSSVSVAHHRYSKITPGLTKPLSSRPAPRNSQVESWGGDYGYAADRDHGSCTGSRSLADVSIQRIARSPVIRTNNSDRKALRRKVDHTFHQKQGERTRMRAKFRSSY